MDNSLAFCIVGAALFLIFVLSPFWLGDGGRLERASVIDDHTELETLKNLVLQRFIQEEDHFKSGHLTQIEWNQRKAFLEGRYLDYCRRLDYLKHGEDA